MSSGICKDIKKLNPLCKILLGHSRGKIIYMHKAALDQAKKLHGLKIASIPKKMRLTSYRKKKKTVDYQLYGMQKIKNMTK